MTRKGKLAIGFTAAACLMTGSSSMQAQAAAAPSAALPQGDTAELVGILNTATRIDNNFFYEYTPTADADKTCFGIAYNPSTFNTLACVGKTGASRFLTARETDVTALEIDQNIKNLGDAALSQRTATHVVTPRTRTDVRCVVVSRTIQLVKPGSAPATQATAGMACKRIRIGTPV